MNKDLDILFLETEIILNECDLGIYQDLMQDTFEYFSEASGSAPKESAFKKIIDRAKKMIADFIEKVKNFFAKKKTKTLIDKADKAFKDNPKLKNAKLKVTDYSKLDNLTKVTISKIVKNPDRADQIFEAYQKSKKVILGSTIAIGAGALLLKFKSMSNQISDYSSSLDRLSELKKDDVKEINKLKADNMELEAANRKSQQDSRCLQHTIAILKDDINDKNSMIRHYENSITELIAVAADTDFEVQHARDDYDIAAVKRAHASVLADNVSVRGAFKRRTGEISKDDEKKRDRLASKVETRMLNSEEKAKSRYISKYNNKVAELKNRYLNK